MDVARLAVVAARVAGACDDKLDALAGRKLLHAVVEAGDLPALRRWHADGVLYDQERGFRHYRRDAQEVVVPLGEVLGGGLVHLAAAGYAAKGKPTTAEGYLDVVRALVLEMGCDVNGINLIGRTPLHLLATSASASGGPPLLMVEALLELGADFEAPDAAGKTPVAILHDQRKRVAADCKSKVAQAEVDARGDLEGETGRAGPPTAAEVQVHRYAVKARASVAAAEAFAAQLNDCVMLFVKARKQVYVNDGPSGPSRTESFRSTISMLDGGTGGVRRFAATGSLAALPGTASGAGRLGTAGGSVDLSDVGAVDVSTDSELSSSPSPLKAQSGRVSRQGEEKKEEDVASALDRLTLLDLTPARAGTGAGVITPVRMLFSPSFASPIPSEGGALGVSLRGTDEQKRLLRRGSSGTLWHSLPTAALEQTRVAEVREGVRSDAAATYVVLRLDRRAPSVALGASRLPPSVQVRRVHPLEGSLNEQSAENLALRWSEKPETGYCVAAAIGPFTGQEVAHAARRLVSLWQYGARAGLRTRCCLADCVGEGAGARAAEAEASDVLAEAEEVGMLAPPDPDASERRAYEAPSEGGALDCPQRCGAGLCEWSILAWASALGKLVPVPALMRPYRDWARHHVRVDVLPCVQAKTGGKGPEAKTAWKHALHVLVPEYKGPRTSFTEDVSLVGGTVEAPVPWASPQHGEGDSAPLFPWASTARLGSPMGRAYTGALPSAGQAQPRVQPRLPALSPLGKGRRPEDVGQRHD
jgi:hypothetical protein